MTPPVTMPGGEAALRRQQPEDAAFLRTLFDSAAAPLTGLPPAMAEALLEMQFRSQQATYQTAFPSADWAIIEQDGHPIGRLIVAPGDSALIVDYALLPGKRNGGTGRAILAEILARMVVTTCANVLADNQPCLAMCARLGFRVIAADPPYLRLEWQPGSAARARNPGE